MNFFWFGNLIVFSFSCQKSFFPSIHIFIFNRKLSLRKHTNPLFLCVNAHPKTGLLLFSLFSFYAWNVAQIFFSPFAKVTNQNQHSNKIVFINGWMDGWSWENKIRKKTFEWNWIQWCTNWGTSCHWDGIPLNMLWVKIAHLEWTHLQAQTSWIIC